MNGQAAVLVDEVAYRVCRPSSAADYLRVDLLLRAKSLGSQVLRMIDIRIVLPGEPPREAVAGIIGPRRSSI